MRAKTITGPSTPAQPARRLSARLAERRAFPFRRAGMAGGRARRWATWAHALADRFRAGGLRGVGAALVLQRQRGWQGAGPIERGGGERTLVANKLFAPHLYLTISPLVRVSGWPGPRSILRSTVLPGGMAVPEARPGAAARTAAAASKGGATTRVDALAQVPLERARARCNAPAAFPPGLSLTLARAGRDLPRAASGELLALAGRVAARGQRRETETPFQRPAATLHQPAPPSEAAAEASARPRRRGPTGSPATSPAFPAGAPGMLTGTPGELDRLTEQVIRRIDRRMDAWRERTGRVR